MASLRSMLRAPRAVSYWLGVGQHRMVEHGHDMVFLCHGTPRAAVGYGCTEAPRGICYHRYEIDADGTILTARIVPPTSQNQLSVEEDLREVATRNIDLPESELRARCEQTIRNYDPCISCSTHFLRLTVHRE